MEQHRKSHSYQNDKIKLGKSNEFYLQIHVWGLQQKHTSETPSQQKQWFIGNGIKWNRLTVSGYGQAIIQE